MAKPSRAKSAQDNKLIYIGPNLRKLFVPVADFVAAEKLAKTAGTPLNKYYKEAMEV